MGLRTIADWIGTTELFFLRLVRAWKFYRQLRYTWRLSWIKAGWQTFE